MRLCKQRMWRSIVPTTQCPVERLGTRTEIHVLDHRMGEKQRSHHSGSQLIRIVGLSDHKHNDKYILRIYYYGGDPAVNLS